MSVVEDDRRTSASDPAPQTTTIEELLRRKRPIYSVLDPQLDDSSRQNDAPFRKPPVVHFEQDLGRDRSITTPSSTISPDDEAVAHSGLLGGDHQRPQSESTSHLAIIDEWMTARPRIAALRNHILTLRMDMKRERTRYSQFEEVTENVMGDFMLVLNSAASNGTYMSSRDELEYLKRRIGTCSDDLKIQREKSTAVEDQLSNLEYQLNKLEEDIYQELDREYRSVNGSNQNIGGEINTPRTTTLSDGNADNSALEELYSRMGDLRVLLDRLNDFEFELRSELDERDALRAVGQVNLSADEQLFEERKMERERIAEDVKQVQSDVNRLKEICTNRGIRFEDVQFPEPLYEAMLSETSTATSGRRENPPPEPPPSQRSGSSSVISNYYSTRHRVKQWLGEDLDPDMYRHLRNSNLQKRSDTLAEADENEQFANISPTFLGSVEGTYSASNTMQDIRNALQSMPSWSVEPGPASLMPRPLGRCIRRRASDYDL